jgi:hypothetical protein
MTEQLLDHTQISPPVKKVGCKRVPQCMRMDLDTKASALRGIANHTPG